jgi:hypothetical protein
LVLYTYPWLLGKGVLNGLAHAHARAHAWADQHGWIGSVDDHDGSELYELAAAVADFTISITFSLGKKCKKSTVRARNVEGD